MSGVEKVRYTEMLVEASISGILFAYSFIILTFT